MSLPDAREALRALGSEPSSASVDWTASGYLEIDGVRWMVSVQALDGRASANPPREAPTRRR
jgi:hypothetical protein